MATRRVRKAVLFVWVLLAGVGGSIPAQAQPIIRAQTNYFTVYRPPGVEYMVYPTEHFDIIFQSGYERSAWLARQVLEDSFPTTDSLIGLDHPGFRMPVVLNGYNDRSNGFVRVLPFKQEIEIPSIIDDVIPTRYSSWMAGVAPHELTHALHAEVNEGFGVGRFIRLFAPDAARSINLFVPSGMTEGIAVYRESQYEAGAGRLNAPLFTMKHRAAMGSDDPWSLAQMLHAPSFTFPFDRHYIAGGHMVQHLAHDDTEGGDLRFFRRTTRFNYRFPFLGYGVALWQGTGETPGNLEDRLQQAFREEERQRLEALGDVSTPDVVASAPGLLHRRPYWLGDETLFVHARGYNLASGFYRVDVRTGQRTRISTQAVTEDFTYSLGDDSTAVLFARYRPDPFVASQSIAEVYRLDVASGRTKRLTDGGRAYAPVRSPDGGIWAIHTDGPFSQWAQIDEAGTVTPITSAAPTRFQQIAPSPDGGTVAVLLNIDGDQSVYRATEDTDARWQLEPWIALDDAVIYDVSWSPDGRYLLFTADPTGVANIFAYDTETERAARLTNVPYGAQEPALSPDGSTLAFVNYRHERYDLVTMPFDPNDTYAPVALAPPSRYGGAGRSGWASARPDEASSVALRLSATADSSGRRPAQALRDVRPYHAWRHLAPRMVYPTLRYDFDERDATEGPFGTELGVGLGLAVEGSDPLQRWAYSGEAFWQDGRPWGEARVENGRYLLRPSLSAYDRPFLTTGRVRTEDGTVVQDRVGVEERGVSLGVRLPVTLRNNVSASLLRVGLETEWRQTRLFDDGDALQDFRNRLTFNPTLVYAYRLLANPRDIAPTQGVVVSAVGEVDGYAPSVTPSRAFSTRLWTYVPLMSRTNTSIQFGGAFLTQNRGSIFNLDTFVPRGYTDTFLGEGNYLRFDAEVVQPITFIEDGWTWLPVYVGALYGYGFAQTLSRAGEVFGGPHRSSVGAGVGVRLRVFYQLALDLRVGAAYQVQERRFEAVYR